MTDTLTSKRAPLTIEDVFAYDPESGWDRQCPDPTSSWLTPGHITIAEFDQRLVGESLRILPGTIEHAWVVLSHHTADCLRDTAEMERHLRSCPGSAGTGTCDRNGGRTGCIYNLFPADGTPLAELLDMCECGEADGGVIEDQDGTAVHLITATADTPGAVAITWGLPDHIPAPAPYPVTTKTARPVPAERIRVRLTINDRDERGKPCTRDLIVDGVPVAPGLAVTDSHQYDSGPGQYTITHLASGLRVADICGRHVDQAVALIIATRIDWTADRETIQADPRAEYIPAMTDDNTWTFCPDGRPGCRRQPWPTPTADVDHVI